MRHDRHDRRRSTAHRRGHARRARKGLARAGALMLLLAGCGGGSSGSRESDDASESGEATPNRAPTASFVATPSEGEAPLTVTFDARDSSDADGGIVAFAWDFGNGATGSGRATETTYESAGSFTARLEVTDDDGATGSASRTIEVSEAQTFAVSGSIRILAGTTVDADTNDVHTADGDNDGFDSAQRLGNPASVGGYVAIAGAGSGGRVDEAGDPEDFYRFSGVGGETLRLTVADAASDNEIDLFLYDAQRELIDAAMGSGRFRSIEVPKAGEHFVEVRAVEDPAAGIASASNYVLAIGQRRSAARHGLRLSDPFVTSEMLLGPPRHPAHDEPAATAREQARVPEGLRLVSAPGREHGPRRMRLPATSHRADRLAGLGLEPVEIHGAPVSAETLARLDTLRAIHHLRRSGRYAYVEPNYVRRTSRRPDDRFLDRQWHYRNIKLEQAWELTTGSPDVVVAVIDTGVLLGHPELREKLTQDGFDFISDAERALDGDGIDPDPDDPGDQNLSGASTFHGTHVAGTVAAETDNATGVAGAGWRTRIMPVRVLGRGGGTSADLLEALRYAGGLENASGTVPDRPADIVNLSLGGGGFSQAEQDAVNALREAGVIVIAAAGNESASHVNFPAGYDGVVGVSATTITNERAFYSNTGGGVDVAAPGGDTSTDVNGDGSADGVLSTLGDDSGSDAPEFVFGILAGTSMATPHVAAVAALMQAEDAALSPSRFDALLEQGALTDDLGPAGRDDTFGHGLINAAKAVTAATDATLPEFVVVSPTTVNFGAGATRLTLDVANAGTRPARVTEVRAQAPWLAVAATDDVDPDTGTGTYAVSVDRSGLGEGTHRAEIVVDTTANTSTVAAVMDVSRVDVDADAGFHFIVLTDRNRRNVGQTTARAENGRYTFRIEDIPPGRYQLAAGTDSDNDGFICDAGEACALFRTLDTPEPIELEGDVSGLEFVTGFRSDLSTGAGQAGAAGPDSPRRPIPRAPIPGKEIAR